MARKKKHLKSLVECKLDITMTVRVLVAADRTRKDI